MPLRNTGARTIVPGGATPGGKSLPVPQINQEQTEWCWAACADMVIDYYGSPAVRQCDFADWLFGLTTCCANPSSSLCNRPCMIADVCRVYRYWGLNCSHTRGASAFAAVQTEINADRPVEIGYTWTGGGGHVAIVRGWKRDAQGPFLLVNDPWYGSRRVYYSDLLAAYGLGIWSETWTDLRK